jgi:topoisomerase-4 subunit A
MKRFSLSDRQAEAILNLRLRNLAKLEEIQIRKEQDELSKEKEQLEKILSSPRRLKTLVGKELAADAKTFGDNRRSPIVTRKEAQALSETDLLPVEPVTVVLSSKGWIRVAKGHEVDCSRLSYKAGDQFLAAAKGRSNQLAVILDSTGRSYSLPVVNLPSARGYGEPLSGHLNLPPGAFFQTVLMGASPDDLFLMASDAGYGFIVKFDNLFSRGRNGKQVLNCPPRALPLLPVNISQPETDLLGTITNEGRMLLFPVNKLPYLPKGKGNKIIQIPPKRASERKEWVVQLFVMPAGGDLLIHAGKRHLSLSNAKLSHYFGERGRRGAKLPRGFQKVDRVETIVPQQLPLL